MLNSFIEQTLQPGPAVSLMCVATANPPPKFTWTLDGFAVRLKILIHFLNEKKKRNAYCLVDSVYGQTHSAILPHSDNFDRRNQC